MTNQERDHLALLEVRLFGVDGEGGAIGKLNDRLVPVEDFYRQATGVLRLAKFLGAGLTLAAIVALLRASGL